MHIASTVLAVADRHNPMVAKIMDRSIPLTQEFCEQVMSLTQLSYHGRNPKPSIGKNGQIRKTNLDLLSLMMDLYRRNAQIELSAYDNQLPWKAVASERHVGGTTRRGPIKTLVSHKEQLSFSVRINDLSVLDSSGDEPTFGAERSYMIANHLGQWSAGWYGFTWDMNPAEQAYLMRRKLLVDGNVDYEDYLHGNRRQSVMGAPYLLLKLLWQRIEDELSFYQAQLKRLERAGVECPADLRASTRYSIAQGDSQSIEVPTFTMRLDGMECTEGYLSVSADAQGYRLAHDAVRFLSHDLRPMVQFMMRADEVAFYRFGLEQSFVSNWIKGSAWEHSGKGFDSASIALGDTLSLSYKKGLVEKKIAA